MGGYVNWFQKLRSASTMSSLLHRSPRGKTLHQPPVSPCHKRDATTARVFSAWEVELQEVYHDALYLPLI